MDDPTSVIKSSIVPALRKRGFQGSFPHFRRLREARTDLLSFQFDKYGRGQFVVELAVAMAGDYETYWGETIPPNKLTAQHLGDRIRLGASGEHTDHWFVFGGEPAIECERVLFLLDSQGERYYAGS